MEYIDIKKGYTEKHIERAKEILENGGIVILPTDTVYGLSADCLNEEAIRKIYKLKHRNYSKACCVLVSNIKMIEEITEGISKKEENIINRFFPGALTIILEKNEKIPQIVTAGLDTIGIRMPDNNFLLDLITELGRPIVTTSLNLAGEESIVNLEKLSSAFKDNVDLIIDGGETKKKLASTIIRVEKEEVKVLRQGPISKEDIEKVC